MDVWWATLSGSEQFLWALGFFSITLFVIQTLMTFIGIGGFDTDISGDADADMDGDGSTGVLHYFTVRNVINFLLGFSWGTLTLKSWGIWTFFAAIGGIFIGAGMVTLMGMFMAALMRLESPGAAIPLERAIGEEGVVAVRIPPLGEGYGKVHISFADRFQAVEAITYGNELRHGDRVLVTNVVGTRLVVKRVEDPSQLLRS